jgi:phosphoribosylanthranilate isomerase
MINVKICGIRRLEDALLATELGASALGFIFWPSSPRFIDPHRARTIVAALPPFVTTVGVFVNQPIEYVIGVARLLNLGAVQLHGDERTEPYLQQTTRVIKAVAVSAATDARERAEALPSRVTVLLDAHDAQRRGGTGKTIDWDTAARIARSRPTILSGGLDAGNIQRAIEIVQPYAVDVSSSVESSPGVKDAGKLRRLFDVLAETRTEHPALRKGQ